METCAHSMSGADIATHVRNGKVSRKMHAERILAHCSIRRMIALMIIQMIFSFIVPFLPIIIPVVIIGLLLWHFYAKIKSFFGGMLARITCLKNPLKYSKCVKNATRGPPDPNAPAKVGKKGAKQSPTTPAANKKGKKAAPPPTQGVKLSQPAPVAPKGKKAAPPPTQGVKLSQPAPKGKKTPPVAKVQNAVKPPTQGIKLAAAPPCAKGPKGDKCRKRRGL
jgi:hypothetical protein